MRLAMAVANSLYMVHNTNELIEEKVAEQLQQKKATKEAADLVDKLPA